MQLFVVLATLMAFWPPADCFAVNINPDGIIENRAEQSCHDLSAGSVSVAIEGGACAAYMRRDASGEWVRTDFGMHISGTVLAFDQGRIVVALQDQLYGRMNADGVFVAGDGSSDHDPFLVLIFRDGKRVAAYRMAEILHRPHLVYTSTFCGYFDGPPCPPRLGWLQDFHASKNAKQLLLHIASLREVTIDLEDGHIAQQNDSSEWAQCEFIVQGPMATRGARGQMGRVNLIKGSLQNALDFAIAPGVITRGDGDIESLCLKNTATGLLATARMPIAWDWFKGDLHQLPVSPRAASSQPPPHFHIDLLGTEFFSGRTRKSEGASYIWKFQVEPDQPMQRMEIALEGSEESKLLTFDWRTGYLVDLDDIPEHARIVISGIDGHGIEIATQVHPFDALQGARDLPKFLMTRLRNDPRMWGELRDTWGSPYLYFGKLKAARCAVSEVRYGIGKKSLDHKFSVAPCTASDMKTYLATTHDAYKRSDIFADVHLPEHTQFVTMQLVFFDGSVSAPVRINRDKPTG
jgi:hypothetical protein